MTTLILVSLLAGVAVGGGVGWKLGRGYERIRPTRKDSKDHKDKRKAR